MHLPLRVWSFFQQTVESLHSNRLIRSEWIDCIKMERDWNLERYQHLNRKEIETTLAIKRLVIRFGFMPCLRNLRLIEQFSEIRSTSNGGNNLARCVNGFSIIVSMSTDDGECKWCWNEAYWLRRPILKSRKQIKRRTIYPKLWDFFYFPIWMDDGALHGQKILSLKINKRSLSHLLLQSTEHEIVVSRDKYVM